jgi:hypothetical protein
VAEVKAFTALALDLARVEPRRRPGAEIVRWYRELVEILGGDLVRTSTNRELALAAMVLRRHAETTHRPAPRPARRETRARTVR